MNLTDYHQQYQSTWIGAVDDWYTQRDDVAQILFDSIRVNKK
jgi:hypothetical protein